MGTVKDHGLFTRTDPSVKPNLPVLNHVALDQLLIFAGLLIPHLRSGDNTSGLDGNEVQPLSDSGSMTLLSHVSRGLPHVPHRDAMGTK